MWSILQQQLLSEADCKNEVKRLSSMDRLNSAAVLTLYLSEKK